MLKFMRSSWGLIISGVLIVLFIIGYNVYDIAVSKNKGNEYTSEQIKSMSVTKVNINTASKSELCELPSISDSIAQAIVDYRELNGKFETLEEIKNVKGIGDKTYQKIVALITI